MTHFRTLTGLLSIVLATCGWAETYYIDYQGGNDGSSGTSKTAAWKHCPAMGPFAGAYSHQAGDRFIFKGGVRWPNAALPLYVSDGGAAGNDDYYGVDQTWYSGAVWSRPVFDAEAAVFTNHGGNRGNMIRVVGASHVTIEGIEMKNFVWDNPVSNNESDGWAVVADGADDVTVRNVYSHDWVVRSSTDSKFGGFGVANDSGGFSVIDCIVKGPATVAEEYRSDSVGQTSGCGARGAYLVDGCDISNTTQGVFSCRTVINCYIHDVCDSFDSRAHENGCWLQNDGEFSNNILANVREGVGVYVLPGWGSRGSRTCRLFNNVFFNLVYVGGGNTINLSSQDNPDETNSIYFLNNTVVSGIAAQIGTTKGGAPFKDLLVQNNLFISYKKYSDPGNVLRILDENDIPRFTNDHNVVMTPEEATAAGLLESKFYRPQSLVGLLVDKGADLSAYLTTDKDGNPRTGSFDVGAYEYQGSGPGGDVVPAAPQSVSALAVSDTSIEVMWSDVSVNEEDFEIQYSLASDSGFGVAGTAPAGEEQFTIGGLAAGTAYFVRVRARNQAGFSAYSSVAGATTPAMAVVSEVGAVVGVADATVIEPFVELDGVVSQDVETVDLHGGRAGFLFNVAEQGDYAVGVLVDAPGEGSNSLFVDMDREPSVPASAWHISVTSGFQWQPVSWQGNGTVAEPELTPKFFTLGPGVHELVIRGRERNTKFKSVVLQKRPGIPPGATPP